MPEPIFTENPFEKENPTLDELISDMPPEAKKQLLTVRLLQREAFQMRKNEQCPCPIHSPSEFEFDVQTLFIGPESTDKIIQAKIDAGWSPDILGAHNGNLLFMFSRKKLCTEEK